MPPALKAEVEAARRVQGIVCSGELEENEKKKRKPVKSVQHFGTWRDGHSYLRHPNGRFAKDTVPKHKRVY